MANLQDIPTLSKGRIPNSIAFKAAEAFGEHVDHVIVPTMIVSDVFPFYCMDCQCAIGVTTVGMLEHARTGNPLAFVSMVSGECISCGGSESHWSHQESGLCGACHVGAMEMVRSSTVLI